MNDKPFAPACERNREPIAAQLAEYLPRPARVLEIGSGTGQHAVHFAQRFPELSWQCSDLPENLPGIRAWLEEAGLPNTPEPLPWDVCAPPGNPPSYEAVFTANTLHIMPWTAVEALFTGLPEWLRPGGRLLVYGPFRYNGRYTSDSNREFDAWLQAQNPSQGIRDMAAITTLADAAGLRLLADHRLPANNQFQVWMLEPA